MDRYEELGVKIVDLIVESGFVWTESVFRKGREVRFDAAVKVWSANAAEQIGELIRRELNMEVCSNCSGLTQILINRRCPRCNPFDACKCGGTLQSKPTANWQNRWVCDACGKEVSK